MPLDQPSFLVSPPEVAWALKHRDRFPVDINRAPSELLRVPGLDRQVAVLRPEDGALALPDQARSRAAAAIARGSLEVETVWKGSD